MIYQYLRKRLGQSVTVRHLDSVIARGPLAWFDGMYEVQSIRFPASDVVSASGHSITLK